MTEWQRLKIGDVCDIVKGETGLANATPGQYPMVATGAGSICKSLHIQMIDY